MLSAQECIGWAVIYVTEGVVIVTLNVITVVAFMRNSNLRKRSTYLLINLAVVDMCVGFTGTCTLYELGTYCFLWKDSVDGHLLAFAQVLRSFFVMSSLVNITNISLKRLHATFYPFRHRFVKKYFYWVVIVLSYLLPAFLTPITFGHVFDYSLERMFKVLSCFTPICIAMIVLCYSLILIKVRCSPHPRRNTEVSREKKLTVTLFIVTAVSLLMWVPYIIQSFLWFITPIFRSWPSHLTCSVIMLLGANSLVNPLLYAIRMPEFKRALKKMFCKSTQERRVQDFPLKAMKQPCRQDNCQYPRPLAFPDSLRF